MPLFGTTSQILLAFKADTKQARKEIRKLSGEQKKAAKTALEASEKQNEGLENLVTGLARAELAVGSIAGAFGILKRSSEEFTRQTQQAAAIQGIAFKRLGAATRGLITDQQALALAARTANGTFKTSQSEMELAAKAAVVLGQNFGDLDRALDRVGQALAEGNVEPLKEYGIIIEAQSDTIQGHNAVLEAFNDLLAENADFAQRSGTATQRAGVQWRNAINELVLQLGRIAVALAPIVARTAQILRDNIEFGRFLAGDTDSPSDIGARLRRGQIREQIFRTPALGVERPSVALRNRRRADRAAGRGGGGDGAFFRPDFFTDLFRVGVVGGAEALRRIQRQRRTSNPIIEGGLGPLGNVRLGPGSTTLGQDPTLAGSGLNQIAFQQAQDPFALQGVRATGQGLGFATGLLQQGNQKEALNRLRELRRDAQLAGQVFESLGANLGAMFDSVGRGAIGAMEAIKIAIRKTIADQLRAFAVEQFAKAAASATTLNFGMAALHTLAGTGLMAAAGFVEGGGSGRPPGAGGGRVPPATRGATGNPGRAQRSEVIVVAPSPFNDDQRGARMRLRDMVDRAGKSGDQGGTAIVRA